MAEQKATHILWHQGAGTRGDRERLSGHRRATVWVPGRLRVCDKRDVRAPSQRAGAGQFPKSTAIWALYDPPLRPEITLRTDAQDVEESVRQVLSSLEQRGIAPRR